MVDLLLFFFFLLYVDLRDLHSFPTRRSSDLSFIWQAADPDTTRPTCSTSQNFAPVAAPRSEEHTSELQSHSDLVCRLLLEKKKIGIHKQLDNQIELMKKILYISIQRVDFADS